MAKNIPRNDTITFEKYLHSNYRESMFAEPITEPEIITEPEKLNLNKNAGYDEFNAKIETMLQEISIALALIFNLTFQYEVIPNALKIALVTPIYKTNKIPLQKL